MNRDRGTVLAERVEKAGSFLARLRGLRGRAALLAGEALWIVPCRGVHTRGMKFPIDVLYLDRSCKILAVEENLPPGRFAPIRWKARTVLELPAGTLGHTGSRPGDRIEIRNPEGI